MVGAEIDLLLDRGSERVHEEIKACRGDKSRAVRTLRVAMPDVHANRSCIVDHAAGIEGVGDKIARGGFAGLMDRLP